MIKLAQITFTISAFIASYFLAEYTANNLINVPKSIDEIIKPNNEKITNTIDKEEKQDIKKNDWLSKNESDLPPPIKLNNQTEIDFCENFLEKENREIINKIKWGLFFISFLSIFFLIKKIILVYLNNEVTGKVLIIEAINESFNKNRYHLLNDITLKFGDGKREINHILISRYGVFVIESNNYNGIIYAHINAEYWTQEKLKIKNKFKNPITKNNMNVIASKNTIATLPKNIFYNNIVFTGNCTFKLEKPVDIYTLDEFINFIKSKKNEVLTENEMLKVIGKIEREQYIISE